VFAAILDADRGGHFALRPSATSWQTKQLYFPDSNVLITRFLTPDGVGEVEDFMPIGESRAGGAHRQRLIRRVVAVRGRMHFELECAPRFDYGREPHRTERHPHGALFETPRLRLALETDTRIELDGGDVRAAFELEAGQSATFILEHVPDGYQPHGHSAEETRALFEATVAHWRRWLSQSRYRGRWRETVHRSALTLKLLTYRPTGAIVAAPTTSLPETPRRAQLGLPLHVDPRRCVLALRTAAARLHGRGGRVHGLAHRPSRRRTSASLRTLADHVRHRRPPRAARTAARPPRGVSRIRPGDSGQRRRDSASA
jgi:GH15 family glucan-1,4-alpha-glucosidase